MSKATFEIKYYVFIDYSMNLIGYNIIEHENIPKLIPLLVKFRHYKTQRHKGTYILKMKRDINNSGINGLLYKQKITEIRYNMLIFLDVLEFVKKNDNCAIFMSIDNNQHNAFIKLFNMIPHKDHVKIVKESELRKKSIEYRLSLIIDNMLTIERLSK